MTTTDTNTFIESIKQQLINAPEGVDTSTLVAALEVLANPEEERVKIWFLLDRSGSMQHLTEDVIGGFNQFLDDQKTKPGKVRRARSLRSHLRRSGRHSDPSANRQRLLGERSHSPLRRGWHPYRAG